MDEGSSGDRSQSAAAQGGRVLRRRHVSGGRRLGRRRDGSADAALGNGVDHSGVVTLLADCLLDAKRRRIERNVVYVGYGPQHAVLTPNQRIACAR